MIFKFPEIYFEAMRHDKTSEKLDVKLQLSEFTA
jgi:hypothetical protein